MTKPPEDIDAMLSQILADPQALSTLQALAERQGITTTVAEMDRTQQIELVTTADQHGSRGRGPGR